MASIKQLSDRKYKITISNGYRTDGRKICKAKTIQVPDSVPKRGVDQYVYHEAERLERLFKQGYSEDGEMTFETYARGWLERQTKYAPGTIAFYRRSLETVFPEIGAIKLNRLRPIALENLLAKLRKRTHRGKPIKEKTVQKYLTVVSAVLSDAKRNEIIEKNPARMIDLPDAERKTQEIPTMEEMQKLLSALCYEEPVFQLFYFLAINTGMRRGELCALRWSDVIVTGSYEGYIIIQHSRSTISGAGVQEGKTKNGRARTVSMSEDLFSLLRGRNAVVLYCADHGEGMGENGNYLHATTNDVTHNPACMIWYSPEYARLFPDKVGAARRGKDLRHTTEVLFHSALDLGAIETPALERSKSLLKK